MSLRTIFLAPPAAGKGTQATLLRDYANVLHLSTGDELRKAIQSKNELGVLAQKYVDSGELVPDEIILKIVNAVLSQNKQTGWILDGFPRNESQVSSLDALLEQRGENSYKVVHFEVSDTTLLERVQKRQSEMQRSDDNIITYMTRLQTYRKLTAPLIDVYKSCGNLIAINGEQDVQDVFSDLKKSLKI
jgi:adenylate kinase